MRGKTEQYRETKLQWIRGGLSDEVAFKMGPEREPGGEQGRSPHDGKGLVVFVELNGSQRE